MMCSFLALEAPTMCSSSLLKATPRHCHRSTSLRNSLSSFRLASSGSSADPCLGTCGPKTPQGSPLCVMAHECSCWMYACRCRMYDVVPSALTLRPHELVASYSPLSSFQTQAQCLLSSPSACMTEPSTTTVAVLHDGHSYNFAAKHCAACTKKTFLLVLSQDIRGDSGLSYTVEGCLS